MSLQYDENPQDPIAEIREFVAVAKNALEDVSGAMTSGKWGRGVALYLVQIEAIAALAVNLQMTL